MIETADVLNKNTTNVKKVENPINWLTKSSAKESTIGVILNPRGMASHLRNEGSYIGYVGKLINNYMEFGGVVQVATLDFSLPSFRWQENPIWEEYSNKIESFRARQIEIERTGIPAPSDRSINNSQAVLSQLKSKDVRPIFISHTADGGILFRIKKGDKRYIFEMYNTGEIVFSSGKMRELGTSEEIFVDNLEQYVSNII